jgi:tetratricopeptide (TPR) repeat protein
VDATSRPERSEGPLCTRWAVPLAAAVIALATLAAYANSFQGVFVFDDEPSILSNPTIRHLWPIWPVLLPPRNGETVSGRPLLNLTFAINYALGGLNPWGYHAVNLAIHILAALTLFGILRRTFLLPGVLPLPSLPSVLPLPSRERAGVRGAADTPDAARPASTATLLAFVIALLWAVHPLQTESVTYIVQRAESLCGLFYLLTLYCVIRGATLNRDWGLAIMDWKEPGLPNANPQSPIPSPFFWYSAAVLACLLGMATKEVMVTAPLMVLLYDRTFMAGSFAGAVRGRWRLYCGLAATWGLLAWLVVITGLLPRRSEFFASDPITYALAQPRALLHYLALSLWPRPLCLDYNGWPTARSFIAIAPSFIAIGILLVSTLCGAARRRLWSYPGAWFFLVLAPTSSALPLTEMAAEHRMYLPLAAVSAMTVLGVYGLGRASARRWANGPTPFAVCGICLTFIAAGALALVTASRNADYRSGISIWEDALVTLPFNARVHINLGNVLAQQGDFSQAASHFRAAIRMNEGCSGDGDLSSGRSARMADPAYRVNDRRGATQIDACKALAHTNLGNVLARQGNLSEAIAQFQAAIQIKPDYAEAYYNLAVTRVCQGDASSAVTLFKTAIHLRPDFAEAYYGLGKAVSCNGLTCEANRYLRKAIEIRPEFVEARLVLSDLLRQEGKATEAIAQLRETLRSQPRSTTTLNALAWILATDPDGSARDGKEAVKLAQRVAAVSSYRDPAALDTLAAAYAEAERFREATTTAIRAREMAIDQGKTELAERIGARLELYRSRTAFRDTRKH